MSNLSEYASNHLKRLIGSFKIYVSSENKYLHISEKSDIEVDLNYWKYLTTINNQ